MAIWFKIAIGMNVIYWGIFFYLLSRRRLGWAASAVGIFHMLFAGVASVAPIRSLLDPNYMGYGLGLLQLKGPSVPLLATLILGWALSAAWVAVGKGRGNWMQIVLAGDIFAALSIGLSILLGGPPKWKFQLGEHLAITGVGGLLVLLMVFTLPFVASAIWAAGRVRPGGTLPPLTSDQQEERGEAEKRIKNNKGLRYSEVRI